MLFQWAVVLSSISRFLHWLLIEHVWILSHQELAQESVGGQGAVVTFPPPRSDLLIVGWLEMILKSKQINLGRTSLGKQGGKRSVLTHGAANRANGDQGHTCVDVLINRVLKELDSPSLWFFSWCVRQPLGQWVPGSKWPGLLATASGFNTQFWMKSGTRLRNLHLILCGLQGV